MKLHWTVNITPAERIARVVVGTLAAIVGLVLLTGATSGIAVLLDGLLVLAGLDFVVTGDEIDPVANDFARATAVSATAVGVTIARLRTTR